MDAYGSHPIPMEARSGDNDTESRGVEAVADGAANLEDGSGALPTRCREEPGKRTSTSTALNNFFQRCLEEQPSHASEPWGASSGLSSHDVRSLARPAADEPQVPASGLAAHPVPAATPAPRPRKKGASFALAMRRSRRAVLGEDQAERCPICQDDLRKGQRVQTLPCFHKMHGQCCAKYFRSYGEKLSCPVCRFDLEAIF